MGRRRGVRIEHRVHLMARQRLSALPAPDLEVPNSSAVSATRLAASNGLLAELLPFPRLDFSPHDSDFQRLVTNIVELAQILTRASGSAIAFRGEQGTICRASSGEGAPPLGALVDTTSGISRQCLDSGTSLRCDDIATDGRVDPEISQAIEIRAVAVVPIFSNSNSNSNDDICGILEVFSSAPGVFTDQHLKTLQQLADWLGSATSMPSGAPIGDSNSPARSTDSPIPVHGWNDVLIDSHLPWTRFIESVVLHIVLIAVLSGLSIIWPRELIVSPPSLREAHIVYYPFSQSFPARESSLPAVRTTPQPTSANQEVNKPGPDREPVVTSDTRATDDGQEAHALTTPPPAMPTFAISRFRKPELGAAVLPPPPDLDEAQARQSHLPDLSVVAPPPDLSAGSGSRRITAPRAAVVPPSPDVRGSISMKAAGLTDAARLGTGSARAADISIVPPPPSLNDRAAFTYGAIGVVSNTGGQVVPPPPSVQTGTNLDSSSKTGAILPEGGASQVVPPPPSLEDAGAGNSVGDGRARANSLADAGSQVVPPAPSMRSGGNHGEGGRINSLGQGDSQVVPPPPSAQFGAGGNSGAAGRGNSLAGARAEGVLPPASAAGDGNSNAAGKPGGARAGKDLSISPVPETGGDRKSPTFQDVQLRVISLTWAPTRSSYFSSFEVFIAEKWLNKKESEFIKLVYEFLPYQQRLSQYGFQDLKVRRLRVTRDSTCDESLMQMAWPEGENGPPGSHHSGDALASTSADRNNALPCYRTTADDYRRAVSRSR